jgi:DNA-binding NtrC family response regulator
MDLRAIQGAVAERFPKAPAEGLAGNLQRKLERGGNAVEAALGELMHQLPGAAGAAVLVVSLDADGKPMVTPISRSSEATDGRVRPYRTAVREFDRKLFRDALTASEGNLLEAARKLRLPTSTFRYRAIKLGLVKPTHRDR